MPAMLIVLTSGMVFPALSLAKMNISFGGSAPGGVMYYLVGAAGNIISRDLPDYNITQVTTGGSTENCKRLLKGELDMGIVYGPHVYMALHNQGPFKNDPTGTMLRGVAKAYEGRILRGDARRFRHQNDERPDRQEGCARPPGVRNRL